MADQWLTTTIVDAYIGAAVRTELCTDNGSYASGTFDTIAQAATSRIQAALRNSGYTSLASASTTTIPVLLTGCVGIWMDLAYNRPEKMLMLPDNWETHFARVTANEILSGDIMLEVSPSAETGIGGVVASETDSSVSSSDGYRGMIFSRKNLSGL